MLVCYAIYDGQISYGKTYRVYDKDTKEFDDLSEYALRSILASGRAVSNIKLDASGNIVGDGIDIKRLHRYDSSNRLTVISELTDNKGNIVGYEAITADSRVVQVGKKDITSAARFGRVTNMVYVEDKDYARLITKNGVDTKVKTIDYLNMDTSWDTATSTAKKIFKANGFELGYSERYTHVEDFGMSEPKDRILNIMYDKNGNILYFEEDADGDSKLSYHGGHLVTETLGSNNEYFEGSSAYTKSIYTKTAFTYNTFDIRENFAKKYRSVIKNQRPVPYLLDNEGRVVYELNLAPRGMVEEREALTNELSGDDDLFGFGLENLVFIHSRYSKFNKRLQEILQLYYQNNTDLIGRLAASDVTSFDFDNINKNKAKNMVILLERFCSNYGIKEDWQSVLKNGIKALKADKEAREREQAEERKKRMANRQSQGSISGLFGMFSNK